MRVLSSMIIRPRTPPGVGKGQGRPVSLLCSRNAVHHEGNRMWLVVSCFQRWINRMALPFFGSANLVRFRTTCERTFEHCVAIALGQPEHQAMHPSQVAATPHPHPYGRKNKQAWKEHLRPVLVPGRGASGAPGVGRVRSIAR